MKRFLAQMSLLAMILFAGNCIFTDNFFGPVGSRKGVDIKRDVESAAENGVLIGYLLNPNVQYLLRTLSPAYLSSYVAGGIIDSVIQGVVAANIIYVEDQKYYTRTSADACVRDVQELAMVNGMTMAIVNDVAAGVVYARRCNLVETGKLIHLGDQLKL